MAFSILLDASPCIKSLVHIEGNASQIVCLVSLRPRQQLGFIVDRSKDWHLTILRAATHETEWGDHDLSQPVTLN